MTYYDMRKNPKKPPVSTNSKAEATSIMDLLLPF